MEEQRQKGVWLDRSRGLSHDSVSRPLFKKVKYTSPKTSVTSQGVLEFTRKLNSIAGYTPVGIADTTTNHEWSFCLMQAKIDANTLTATWLNLNKGTWTDSVGYVTVLYIRS